MWTCTLPGAAHIINKNGELCQRNLSYCVAEMTLLHFCAIVWLLGDALLILLYSYIYVQLDQDQPTNEDIGREYGDGGYNCIS
jgi:hypothetical protein